MHIKGNFLYKKSIKTENLQKYTFVTYLSQPVQTGGIWQSAEVKDMHIKGDFCAKSIKAETLQKYTLNYAE